MLTDAHSRDGLVEAIVHELLKEDELREKAEMRSGYSKLLYGLIPIIIFACVASQLPKLTNPNFMLLGLFSLIGIGICSVFFFIPKTKRR